MNDKLYTIYPIKYPEDWGLYCAKTELEAIRQYCEDTDREEIPIDLFYEKYEINEILYIRGRKIKEIIFE